MFDMRSTALNLDNEWLLPNQDGAWRWGGGLTVWRAASLPEDEGQRKLLELRWDHCKARQNGFLGEVKGGRQMVRSE